MTTQLHDEPGHPLSKLGGTATGDEDGRADARLRVLSHLRDALKIIDDELDEGVVGAKLSECIERLAEGASADDVGDDDTGLCAAEWLSNQGS